MNLKNLVKNLNLLVLFFMFTSFYSIAPYFAQAAKGNYGISATHIGYIYAAFPLGYMIFSVLLTFLKKTSQWSVQFINQTMRCMLFMVIALQVCFSFVPRMYDPTDHTADTSLTYALIFGGLRGVMGASVAVIDVVMLLYITKAFPTKTSAVVGEWEAAAGLGCVVGPPIGGGLYALGGFETPLTVMAGLTLLVTMGTLVLNRRIHRQSNGDSSRVANDIEEGNVSDGEQKSGTERVNAETTGEQTLLLQGGPSDPTENEYGDIPTSVVGKFKIIFALPFTLTIGPQILCTLGIASLAFVESLVPLFLKERYGMGPSTVGGLSGATAVCYAFVAIVFGGFIGGDRRKLRPRVLAVSGVALAVVFYFMAPVETPVGLEEDAFGPYSGREAMTIIAFLVTGLVLAVLVVTSASTFIDTVKHRSQELVAAAGSISNVMSSLGGFLGPVAGAHLVEGYGFETAFLVFSCTLATAGAGYGLLVMVCPPPLLVPAEEEATNTSHAQRQ